MEWKPLNYLGTEMYTQWQDALADEEVRRVESEKRQELRRVRKEERLQRELAKVAEDALRSNKKKPSSKRDMMSHPPKSVIVDRDSGEPSPSEDGASSLGRTAAAGQKSSSPMVSPMGRGGGGGMKRRIFNRWTIKRTLSSEKLEVGEPEKTTSSSGTGLPLSPSMPIIAHSAAALQQLDDDGGNDSDNEAKSIAAASDSALQF